MWQAHYLSHSLPPPSLMTQLFSEKLFMAWVAGCPLIRITLLSFPFLLPSFLLPSPFLPSSLPPPSFLLSILPGATSRLFKVTSHPKICGRFLRTDTQWVAAAYAILYLPDRLCVHHPLSLPDQCKEATPSYQQQAKAVRAQGCWHCWHWRPGRQNSILPLLALK